MKKFIATVVTSLAFGLAASAPAHAQNVMQNGVPDPSVTAAVHELFDAMNYRTLMAGMTQQMSQNIGASMRAGAQSAINSNPRLDAAGKEKAMAQLEQRLPGMIAAMQKFIADPTLVDEILEVTMPLYAREYTVPELKQITAFYRSPVGAKMLALSPRLMGEVMQTSQQILARHITPLVAQQMQQAQPAQEK